MAAHGIEGFEDLTECPNYSRVEADAAQSPVDDNVPSDHKKTEANKEVERAALALSSGNALTSEEGHQLTGERMANVVVLMGMVKSGKTTVLAEIYERFLQRTFLQVIFLLVPKLSWDLSAYASYPELFPRENGKILTEPSEG